MQTFWQDIRFSIRLILKRPSFTFIAVITLALGIGANTAIFSLVNTVLLRPLQIEKPEQVYQVVPTSKTNALLAFSYPDYVDFRDRNDVLAGLIATRFAPVSLSQSGGNERLWSYLVTGNYFDVLGVKAIKGRTFAPEEDKTKLSHPVAVLSYGCWQKRFGGNQEIIGKEVSLNGHNFKVIGIAPQGFKGTEIVIEPEIYVPMMMLEWIEPGSKWLDERFNHNIFVAARLKDGVSPEQAEASLNIIANQLAKEYPDTNEGITISLSKPGFVIPVLRDTVVTTSVVLMGIVGLVLLLACINIANLLLARSTERRKEIAIRLSIGASRFRIVRQLLTESVLIALIGGTVGLLLGVWLVDLVVAYQPQVDIPFRIEIQTDWRVFIFSFAASLITGVVFGLIPALRSTQPEIVPDLKDATSQSSFRRSRLVSGLVVAQISLSLILLIAAGLVLRTMQQLQTMDVGFTVEKGLVMSFDVSLQGYDEERGKQFQKQVIERVNGMPGVKSAALTGFLPLSLNVSYSGFFVEGKPAERGMNIPNAMNSSVSTGYFKTMGVTLLGGREFTEQDTKDSAKTLVVNEAFVRRFIPELKNAADAIGKRVSRGSADGPFIQIIGVTTNGKYFSITEDTQPIAYFPLAQNYNSFTTLVVRTESDERKMIAPIRREIQQLDASLPVFQAKTVEEHLGFTLFPSRAAASLLSTFGLLALILAAIGIYGVMAYAVSQRTREIGIRMALGAKTSDVLKMILKQGLSLVFIGVAIGASLAFALTRLMTSLLYGISATDPLTFAAIALLLMVVAFVACFLPARRASKVDPMIALRYE